MSPLTSQSDNPTDANAAAEALKRTSGIRPNAWYLQLGMKTALANGVYTGGFPDQSKIENRLPFADYVPVSINGCWSCKGERRPGIGTSVVVDLDQLYIHEFDTTTLLESQLEFVIDQITLSTMIDNK
ncbi:hypothetical protein QRG94_004340 [Salmonella enterica]|nr:hypothetical protein [Salmonella enterica]